MPGGASALGFWPTSSGRSCFVRPMLGTSRSLRAAGSALTPSPRAAAAAPSVNVLLLVEGYQRKS